MQEGLGRTRATSTRRTQNPTREALERNVASLEGGTHGFAFGSGLAALDAMLKLLRSRATTSSAATTSTAAPSG